MKLESEATFAGIDDNMRYPKGVSKITFKDDKNKHLAISIDGKTDELTEFIREGYRRKFKITFELLPDEPSDE